MRPAVAAAFTGFTAQFEGIVPEMYTDVLGLVTTGIGNLIDPVAAALYLPWTRRSDGGLASAAEVAAEWGAVKTGKLAWYPRRAPRPLFLTSAAVSALVARRLNANEVFLAKRWPNWAQWPADAQLAAHSCAWAAGPAWHAPAFDTAVGQLHFYTCAGAQGDAGADPSCRGSTTPAIPAFGPATWQIKRYLRTLRSLFSTGTTRIRSCGRRNLTGKK
jgi:hypothetical protein